MDRLFSPNSRFMAGISRLADLIILNILFLAACLPVFTIGASAAALYHVVFRIGTKHEQGVFRSFFRAFRANFRQATCVWLVLLLAGAALAADYYLFSHLLGGFSFAHIPILLLALLALITACYAFPLISFFSNTLLETLKNAMFIGIGNLPVSLLLMAVLLLPAVLLARFPLLFFNLGFLWVALYFSAGAYLSSLLLRRVLQPYLPEDAFQPEEME